MSKAKTTTTVHVHREESPEALLAAALDGDAGAIALVLQGALSGARVLVPSRKGYSRRRSLAAARTFFAHGQELPHGRGKTPAEAWAAKIHCPIDGSVLIDGENYDLRLNYGNPPPRDLLISIRLLAAAGRLGATHDDAADRVEEILDAGKLPTSGRFWARAADLAQSATAADRAKAEAWLDEGPGAAALPTKISIADEQRGIVVGSVQARGDVTIGGNATNCQISTGSPAEPAHVTIWREKLAFLQSELARSADAGQKFSLESQISEIQARLYREGQP